MAMGSLNPTKRSASPHCFTISKRVMPISSTSSYPIFAGNWRSRSTKTTHWLVSSSASMTNMPARYAYT